jgi:hypothetical protein
MGWPLSQDYNEAIQDAQESLADPELRQGEVTTNALGLPVPRSGNFADVYRFHCAGTGDTWAVKCFTREVPGLRERYQAISDALKQLVFPFMVDFQYQEQGIRIRNDWYPILKMRWVEGLLLNEFVRDNLDKASLLQKLSLIWVRMARRLREAQIAHGDLQHGNVLLVAGRTDGSLAVKLIDYDGMYVPALAQVKSGELGHANYQHPQRLREGGYHRGIDRFPLLVVATALRALSVGGAELWQRHDNGDNLLFKESDFRAPRESALFQELQRLSDPKLQMLVDELRKASEQRLEQVCPIDELLPETKTVVKSAENPPEPAIPLATPIVPPSIELAPVPEATPVSRRRAFPMMAAMLGVAAVIVLALVAGLLSTWKARNEKLTMALVQGAPEIEPKPKVEPPAKAEPKSDEPKPKVETKTDVVPKVKEEPTTAKTPSFVPMTASSPYGSQPGASVVVSQSTPSPLAPNSATEAKVFVSVASVWTSALKKDPKTPIRTAVLKSPHAYVLDRSGGLWTFLLPSTRDDKVVEELQHIPDAGDGFALTLLNDHLLCSARGSLEVYSLKDPARPRKLGKFGPDKMDGTVSMVGYGARLILLGPECLSVFDVSDVAAPRHLGTTRRAGLPWNGCVVGKRLYVAEMEVKLESYKDTRNGISVYDLTDPANLKELAFIPTESGVYHLLPVGKDRFVALTDQSARLFSVADPLQPVALGKAVAAHGRTGAIVTADGISYLVCGGEYCRIEDKELVLLGTFGASSNLDGQPYHAWTCNEEVIVPGDQAAVVLRLEPKATARLEPPAEPRAPAPTPPPATAAEKTGPPLEKLHGTVVPLFTGVDLKGWDAQPGYWRMTGGVLLGSCPLGQAAHTFLISKRTFKDFELKFQVRCKDGIGNSGVQFRSQVKDRAYFQVTGPQCEIAAANALWPPGSLVFEGKGPETTVKSPRADILPTYRNADYNAYTIRCVGKHVTIKVNGITAIDGDYADVPGEGVLAFQIHGKAPPREVTFKDIELLDFSNSASEVVSETKTVVPVDKTEERLTSLKERLTGAKATYDKETKQRRKRLLEMLESAEQGLRKGGNAKLVEQVKSERALFEQSGEVPRSVNAAKYVNDTLIARSRLIAEYTGTIKEYTKLKIDARATLVQKELEEFLSRFLRENSSLAASVGTCWSHSRGAFRLSEGNVWIETQDGNARFSFVEAQRTPDYVLLYDRSRECRVFLHKDRCVVQFNKAPGKEFYRGQWTQ